MNADRYFEIVQAARWAGGVVTHLNIRWSVDECIYALDDSGAAILVFDDAFAEQARTMAARAPAIRASVHMTDKDDPVEDAVGHEELISRSEPAEDAMRSGMAGCIPVMWATWTKMAFFTSSIV